MNHIILFNLLKPSLLKRCEDSMSAEQTELYLADVLKDLENAPPESRKPENQREALAETGKQIAFLFAAGNLDVKATGLELGKWSWGARR